MQIHGHTRSITLDAKITNAGDTLVVDGRTVVDRRHFGISMSKGPGKEASMKNRVRVSAAFIRT